MFHGDLMGVTPGSCGGVNPKANGVSAGGGGTTGTTSGKPPFLPISVVCLKVPRRSMHSRNEPGGGPGVGQYMPCSWFQNRAMTNMSISKPF